MAIDTAGGLGVPRLDRLAMETAIVRRLFVGMTSRTGNFLRRGFVWGTFNVRMAVHACEQASVHGVLEGLRIDMQTHWFAADVVGQSGVTVARKAIVRRRLRWVFLCARVCIQAKKEEESNSRRNLFPKCLREHALPTDPFHSSRLIAPPRPLTWPSRE